MRLPCAWEITHGDPSIVVGVIDVFFDDIHPDLENKFIDIKGGCNTSISDCAHGYAVAGGVAATVNNGLCVAGAGYNTRLIGYCADLGCGALSGFKTRLRIADAINDGVNVINISAASTIAFGQQILQGPIMKRQLCRLWP